MLLSDVQLDMRPALVPLGKSQAGRRWYGTRPTRTHSVISEDDRMPASWRGAPTGAESSRVQVPGRSGVREPLPRSYRYPRTSDVSRQLSPTVL